MNLPRLYVISSHLLNKGAAAAQSAHAVAEFAIKEPLSFQKWNNNYIVLLKGDVKELGLSMLANSGHWVDDKEVELPLSTCYHEPDRNNEVTAWAVLATNEKELEFCERMFKDLPLL